MSELASVTEEWQSSLDGWHQVVDVGARVTTKKINRGHARGDAEGWDTRCTFHLKIFNTTTHAGPLHNMMHNVF